MKVIIKLVDGTEVRMAAVDDCFIKKNSITYVRELLEIKKGDYSSYFNWSNVIYVICKEDSE